MSDKPNHAYVEPWQGCALAWSEGPRMQDSRVCGKPREAHPGQGWQPIETAPRGEHLLYFPPEEDRRLPAWIKVDRVPAIHVRKPTHWMPLPEPPK
jgi:hypothetical protein